MINSPFQRLWWGKGSDQLITVNLWVVIKVFLRDTFMKLRKDIFAMYHLRICLVFFKHITQPHCLFLQVANETRVSQEQTHGHKVRYSLRYLKFMWISNLLAGNDGKSPYSACISCSKWLWAHIGLFFLSLSQIKTAMLLKFEFENVTGERCFGF